SLPNCAATSLSEPCVLHNRGSDPQDGYAEPSRRMRNRTVARNGPRGGELNGSVAGGHNGHSSVLANPERPIEWEPIPTWKRALDLTCVLLLLPVWLTFMVLVTFWIKAVSPGPIFYRQERIGYRGR